ncbi:MAG: hypothetical protein ACTSSK_07725 [Candidatus Heimdallarchaeota archaeon]
MTPLLSDSVPLFLFHEESFLLYIIDSELFYCYSPHHWAYYGYRGLSLLATLFSSSTHTVPVPELFHEFFKHHTFPTDFDEVNDFVIGGIGYFGFPSLDFQLLHNDEKGANDILLHSFQFDDGPLSSFDVSVSQKDAFLILGNHCINKRRGRLLYDHPAQTVNYMSLTLKTKTEKAFWTLFFIRIILSSNYQTMKSPFPICLVATVLVCFLYSVTILLFKTMFKSC